MEVIVFSVERIRLQEDEKYEHNHLLLCTAVRWLSRGEVRTEVQVFLIDSKSDLAEDFTDEIMVKEVSVRSQYIRKFK